MVVLVALNIEEGDLDSPFPELVCDDSDRSDQIHMFPCYRDIESAAGGLFDANLVVAAHSDCSIGNVVEGTEGQKTKQASMYTL
jgi:hypothetical protein